MSTTQHTGHYNLPTFGDNPNDRPSWRGDFTDAMTKVDNQMYANATNITTATSTANEAKTAAQSAQSAVQGVQASIDSVTSATTENSGKITEINSILDSLHAETTTDANNLYQRIQSSKTYGKPRAVMFGDSWTVYNNGILRKTINETGLVNCLKNYGVAGAYTTDLRGQVDTAKADETINRNEIDIVIVVCGTNDVFWHHNSLFADMVPNFRAIVEAYPNAKVHYFPDNSRTGNNGNNEQYKHIVNAAAYSGIAVHPEYLYITWWDNYSFYLGNDVTGVQHLTTAGYTQLGKWIVSTICGSGSLIATDFSVTAPATITFGESYSKSSYNTIRFSIHNGLAHMQMSATLADYVSSEDASHPFKITVKNDESTDSLPFILSNGILFPVYASGSVGIYCGTWKYDADTHESVWSINDGGFTIGSTDKTSSLLLINEWVPILY